jgi:hypothetical protein
MKHAAVARTPGTSRRRRTSAKLSYSDQLPSCSTCHEQIRWLIGIPLICMWCLTALYNSSTSRPPSTSGNSSCSLLDADWRQMILIYTMVQLMSVASGAVDLAGTQLCETPTKHGSSRWQRNAMLLRNPSSLRLN